jgi:4-hydroxybenzoate polyprenyltransferase
MSIRDYIKISRPIFWIVFPLVFYIGLRVSGANLSIQTVLMMVMLSFPICMAGYGINDVYDYESDVGNPRKRTFEGHIVLPAKRKFIKRLSLSLIVVLFLISIATLNPYTIGFTAAFVFLGYFYSTPPIRLKNKPPFDSLSNGLIYLLLPFLMGFSAVGEFSKFPPEVSWLTLCVSSIHAIASIMDVTADRNAGLTTFAIKFGPRVTAVIAFTSFLLTVLFGQLGVTIRSFLIFCSVAIAILIALPTERMARLVGKAIYAAFIIAVVVFLIRIW